MEEEEEKEEGEGEDKEAPRALEIDLEDAELLLATLRSRLKLGGAAQARRGAFEGCARPRTPPRTRKPRRQGVWRWTTRAGSMSSSISTARKGAPHRLRVHRADARGRTYLL